MRFRTRVDAWMALAVGFGLFAGLAGGTAAAIAEGYWWIVPLVLAGDCVVALFVWPCDYTLLDDRMVVRSGFLRYTVPYAAITRVSATRSTLSAPAWSLDRLLVEYGGKKVLVSPLERNEFLVALMGRAGLRQQGQELVRAAPPGPVGNGLNSLRG